jgi:hypothetical protein
MPQSGSPIRAIGSGGRAPGPVIPLPHHMVRQLAFGSSGLEDTAAERRGGGPAATPAPNLTHMSLEADTHVMTWFPGHLNADAYVIFHAR